MNPWAGLIAGPALVAFGLLARRNPRRFSSFSDLGFRAIYHLTAGAYEGSRAQRFTLSMVRIGGILSLLIGIGLFVAGGPSDSSGGDVGTATPGAV